MSSREIHSRQLQQNCLKRLGLNRSVFPAQIIAMKWSALPLGLLASTGMAAPIDARDGFTVYSLRIAS